MQRISLLGLFLGLYHYYCCCYQYNAIVLLSVSIAASYCDAFLPTTAILRHSKKGSIKEAPDSILLSATTNGNQNGIHNNNNNNGDDENMDSIRTKIIRKRIIDSIMNSGSNTISMNTSLDMDDNETSLSSSTDQISVEMKLVGKGVIGPNDDRTLQSNCLFLTKTTTTTAGDGNLKELPQITCIPIPLPSSSSKNILQLLSFAYQNRPISKSLCLTLSPILINRDGSLYDNLPWSTWTIDPSRERTRDAAGNSIDSKYHLGKRDAYNRFMGKDWYGRSFSIGNLAARARFLLDSDNDDTNEDEKEEVIVKEMKGKKENKNDDKKEENKEVTMNEDAVKVLAKRVLELEVKEARMAVAAAEEQLAIVRSSTSIVDFESMQDDVLIANYEMLQDKIQAVQDAQSSFEEAEDALSELMGMMTKGTSDGSSGDDKDSDDNGGHLEQESSSSSMLPSLLSMIMKSQKSDAPYRGAIGYKPTIDTKEEMFEKSILPYSSPYELMTEIINEQLNADVIGCIIENTSLFDGGVVLGGALILERRGVPKKVFIDGERIEMNDSYDDFGNDGIQRGYLKIVECDCDEAIGMAITNGLSISIESDVWDKSQVICTLPSPDNEIEGAITLPNVDIVDKNIFLETQGDGVQSKGIPIQVPRDNNDSFGAFFASSGNQEVFNTDIPVDSLREYDEMTVKDKAQLLLSLESFKGRLPRPRVLQEAKDSNPNNLTMLDPLDKLLLPLIDESVRRQILSREAKQQGDGGGSELLDGKKSMRQIAKENAEQAREDGNDDLADVWEKEAELYASLRADVTQDEGSYSSFLDRDEWYERNRRAVAERNKKRFGSLLNDSQEE